MKIYPWIKRGLDIVLSGVAILAASPLLIVIVLVLLCTGDHDVIYGQERIGLHNRHFKIWKFVTMVRNAEHMGGGMHTVKGDSRVTTFGRILRMTKLNEVPQIFNIFFGDMSFMGPRPQTDETFAPYSDEVKANIYKVRPGLTGIGSIVFRDEERILSECGKRGVSMQDCYDKEIMPYKGALEMWYLRHIGFWTDLKLFFATAWIVLTNNGDIICKWFRDLPARPAFLDS